MNSILSIIKSLTPSRYIVKSEKTELENLCKNLDETKYEKLIPVINNIITSTIYTKKLKETVDDLLKELTEEEIKQENNLIEEIKEEIKEIYEEDLEKKLDNLCERYNKFTESNPAEYIYFDKSKNKYILDYKGKRQSKKNISEISILLKNKLGEELSVKVVKLHAIKKIEYSGKKIIIYLTENNEAYFDINHVINLIDNKNQKNKYFEYKNEIEKYDIRDNEYGGFYVKEFINQETFYRILLHSNSIFARKFKDEISKILDVLTKKGLMQIVNDKIVLVENKKPIEYLIDDPKYIQTYGNVKLVNYVKERITEFKKSNWNKYLHKHIMYLFITTLEDPQRLNRILCKIGYSCDLLSRIKSLEGEYKCKFYLIGVKLVHNIQDEKEFHNLLKKQHPELIVDLKINNIDKDECYVFDINLYQTYLNYVDRDIYNIKELEIEEETKLIMNEYLDNMEERYEKELLLKMKSNINIGEIKTVEQKEYAIELNNKYYDYMLQKESCIKYYDLMTLKELNHHKEVMKKIESEKEIRLKEIELEILKLSK